MRWANSWVLGLALAANGAGAADPGAAAAAAYVRALPQPPVGWSAEAPVLASDGPLRRKLKRVYRSGDGAVVRLDLSTNPMGAAFIALQRGGGVDGEKYSHGGFDGVRFVDDRSRFAGLVLEINPGQTFALEVGRFGRDARILETFLKHCDLAKLQATLDAMFRDSFETGSSPAAAEYAGYFPPAPPGWKALKPTLVQHTIPGIGFMPLTEGVLARTYRSDDGASVAVVLATDRLDEPRESLATVIAMLEKSAVHSDRGLRAFGYAGFNGMLGVDSRGRTTFVCLRAPKSFDYVVIRANPLGRDEAAVERFLRLLEIEKIKVALKEKDKRPVP